MTRPSISVVIPAFNCASYISRSLNSVLEQCVSELEIIVVNDGSTDDTAAVLAGYADRIRVVDQENQGVAAARNRGLELATGDWIAFLDADDVWHQHKLSLQLRVAQRFSDAVLVFTGFRMVDARDRCLVPDAIKSYYGVFGRQGVGWSDIFQQSDFVDEDTPAYFGDCFQTLFQGNFIKTSTVLVRREALDKVGPFRCDLSTEEDYDLWLRLGLAMPVAYLDSAQVDARRRPDQLTCLGNASLVAENAGRVISLVADAAAERLGQAVVNKRLAEIYRNLARVRLLAGDHGLARRAARDSLRYASPGPALLGMMAWSWLPGAVTRGLAQGVRATRKAMSSVQGG